MPLRIRELPSRDPSQSGVLVLVPSELTNGAIARQCAGLVGEERIGCGHAGLTAGEVGLVLGIGPVLAFHFLEEAEGMKLVVRDRSLEGVKFFPNKFGW